MDLLDQLQAIENDLGRVKTIDKGPRNIDLDILTYQDQSIETERLTVPHRLMLEREFVLRPLCEYVLLAARLAIPCLKLMSMQYQWTRLHPPQGQMSCC